MCFFDRFALNVVGFVTLPFVSWIDKPFDIVCGTGQSVEYGGRGSNSGNTNPPITTRVPTTTHVTNPQTTYMKTTTTGK